MDQVAVLVAQELDLYVARPLDVTLDENVLTAKGHERLPPSVVERAWKVIRMTHHAHSPSAAALGGLENDGIPHLPCVPLPVDHVDDRILATSEHRNAGIGGNLPGLGLVAQALEHLHLGTDEDDPRALTGTGEFRIFGQESVPGVDRVHLIFLGQRDDPLDVEVGPDRLLRLADQIRFIGLEAVKRISVLVRVDRDRPNAQLMGRAEDANRDLATIGDEEFPDLFHEVRQ